MGWHFNVRDGRNLYRAKLSAEIGGEAGAQVVTWVPMKLDRDRDNCASVIVADLPDGVYMTEVDTPIETEVWAVVVTEGAVIFPAVRTQREADALAHTHLPAFERKAEERREQAATNALLVALLEAFGKAERVLGIDLTHRHAIDFTNEWKERGGS